MKFISTRGQAPVLSFEDVATSGLASDGGLYLPESYPKFSEQEIRDMASLSYQELAHRVMYPFVKGALSKAELQTIIDRSYSTFRHPDIAPLIPLEEGHYVLELFHGPTLAFKDFALQFLGNLLDFFLARKGQDVVILGATSGDTGSAAIEGCRGCKHIQLFMLHPYNRVSDVQRKQMTTVLADNIHNLAIGAPSHGNFDDCQDMVKHMFRYPEFLGERKLTAVNSINWARIMAQIVYYFYAALKLGAPDQSISFSVPTGNFGDIFAGYVAKRMGLPVAKLIVATNKNDILDRFFKANDYSKQGVTPTTSPSMDIQISSNFERMLFELHDRDSNLVRNMMEGFTQDGRLTVSSKVIDKARAIFASHATDDAKTKAIIQQVYQEHNYLLCPHTATGINASWTYKGDEPIVTLATAHPAKFPEVVEAASGVAPALPDHLADLFEREERMVPLPNELESVKRYIQEHS